MASYHKRWGLMELQPGHVNWSGTPVRLYPGAIRLWIWTAFAHGAEFVTTYRYRQPRFGIELFHHGLVGTDGITPSPGGRQFAQVIQEMRKLDLRKIPKFAEEVHPRQAVGLILDFDQLWYFLSLPQAKRWNQSRWLASWYTALSRLGVAIQILRPGAEWPDDLPLIVAPAVQMVDDELMGRFDQYARTGGNLVLTCRTGLMDRTGQLFEGPLASPILPLIGATIDDYDCLREDQVGQINFEGKNFAWNIWGDQLTPKPGTQVLATYADQFYAGAPAITRASVGKGTVSYFGSFSEQPLVNAFVETLAKFIGPKQLQSQILPARMQVLQRGPYRIALNYQDKPVVVPAGSSAKFLIGSRNLSPADVAVWEE
jgi:beta-galactosidase